MTSKLLRKPMAGEVVHRITPEDAGWSYVGFEVRDVPIGTPTTGETGDREACLVLVSGKARMSVGGQDFGLLGERKSPFEGSPWSLYAPARSAWEVVAETAVELAICSAPATGKLPARIITPDEVGQETRGKGTNIRYVRNILPDTGTAESLLVVEVITPGGHWSSYPPHKHDVNDPPRETYLEETYYHRLKPPQGFAFQRIYTDDRSLDETLTVADGDVVLVPKGYHPVGAPHGYDLYYLNTMAGPKRVWRFRNDPAHEWLMA